MLARVQRVDDLLRMQGGRRDQEHGVEVRLGEQLGVIGESARDAELALRPFDFARQRTAGGGERCARHAAREILRVAAAHAAEAGNADAKRRLHRSTIRRSRQEIVAASASASAFTPSSIDVRTGLPLASASKKCAISAAYAAR